MRLQSTPPAEPAGPLLQGSPVAPSEGDLLSSGTFVALVLLRLLLRNAALAGGVAALIWTLVWNSDMGGDMMASIVGVVLVALFGLQYGGIIDVNWMGMQARYDGFVDWLTAYAGALRSFMAANLASAASFSAGLLMGLRL